MNTAPLPTEFHWATAGAANGTSGEGLASKLVSLVREAHTVKTICDLGCGNGYISGRLASMGYQVTGVDASDSGIDIAVRNHPTVRFAQAVIDSELGASIGNNFDLVISSDVIEHLYRPASLLEAANTLLKPRGTLILGTPYHGYVKNLVLALTGKMDAHFSVLHDGGHIKFFSVKTLTEVISNSGFTDLRFAFYGRAPMLWKNMICVARKSD